MPREKKTPEPSAAPLLPEAPITELTPAAEPEPQPIEIKIEPPAPVAPVAAPKKASNLGQSLWRLIVFLFKLLLTLAILAGIGAALYFGWPIVYRRYILPVQENTTKLIALETQQAAAQTQIAGLETRVAELQAQIEAGAALQAEQEQNLSDLETQLETTDFEIETQSQAITALENLQSELQAENANISDELERQIKLLKSMELLSRARLFLYQSNFGLAKTDLQTARSLLAEIQPAAPADLQPSLTETLKRLDLALGNLPNFPVAASDDLDIAWQVLLQGLPAAPALPTATPLPAETPTPAAPEVATPTATP